MTINVLLDVNIVLDLLLKRENYYKNAELFAFLRQKEYPLFFAACALPSLEYIHTKEIKRLVDEGLIKSNLPPRELARQQLTRFLEAIKIAPSLGSHWRRIPTDHPDREDGLISLSSAELPGLTFIWTSDADFSPAVSEIAFGDGLALQQYLENKAQRDLSFVDLGHQQSIIRENLEGGIFRVLKHGHYIMGPEVKELEQKLAEYVGVKHAISCASGTDALLMALMAYGVGPGDAIFTTPFTFIATAEVISLLGATPVFVDIDPVTFNIDPAKLDLAIQAVKAKDAALYPLPNTKANIPSPTRHEGQNNTPSPLTGEGWGEGGCLRPRGIIPVDLFGLPADYDRINAIAKEHGLFVIEDAAQSFGAEYKGKKACSLAEIACASFFPAKPLGCYGDGGMCFTDDDNLAAVLDSIRVHGKGSHKYDNARMGINGRLDTLQAAILLAKFEIFPEEVQLRQTVANRYSALLDGVSFQTPHIPSDNLSSWAQYSVLAKDEAHRATLMKRLQEAKIPTAIYYPKPLHQQMAFAFLGYKMGAFPVSENAANRIFSLPMHPYLAEQDQTKIAEAIKR
jgi:dTDP-4-amino-4,6-dideoxygalactose transaminase